MSNHTHIVLHVDPNEAQAWPDEEVARRWLAVFPGTLSNAQSEQQKEYIVLGLRSDPQRLKEIRTRLGSLSWFMRALNEQIARWANEEDGCSGRFWEGRFKSQVLLEEQAVVAGMAYVDLNPVRAGMCDTLEDSDYTSVQSRLKERSESGLRNSEMLGRPLKPVAGLDANALFGMTESSYLDLVQWTGEQAHPLKRGKLNSSKAPATDRPPEILWSLARHPKQWTRQVQGTETLYYRAIGSAEAMMTKAAEIGQRWMKGVSGERAWLILRSQTE